MFTVQRKLTEKQKCLKKASKYLLLGKLIVQSQNFTVFSWHYKSRISNQVLLEDFTPCVLYLTVHIMNVTPKVK